MLELRGLSKNYGKVTALKDVSLTIKAGEAVALVGPEGAGKSTLFRIAMGLTPPTDGTVILAETDLADDPIGLRSSIGFVPQGRALYESMLLFDFLRFAARLKGVGRKEVLGEIRRVGERTGLGALMSSPVAGMDLKTKRRVALAQALLAAPKVLFLDAPLAGLDDEAKEEIRDLIVAIRKEATLCVATDSLDEALAVADRLIIMNGGRVLADGTMEELLAAEETLVRFVLVVKGPKPEELTEVIQKLKAVTETERITTRKPEMAGIEITATAGDGVKEAIKAAVAGAQWDLIRIGRKALDLRGIYTRLTGV